MIAFKKATKKFMAVLIMLALVFGEYGTTQTMVYAAEPETIEANIESADSVSEVMEDSESVEFEDNTAGFEEADESDTESREYDEFMTDIPDTDILVDSEDLTDDIVEVDTEEMMDSEADESEDTEAIEDEMAVDAQESIERNGETELPELRDYLSLEDPSETYYIGTENNPFLIGSLADLERVRDFYDDVDQKEYQWLNNQSQHFKLTSDIALTGTWEPIKGCGCFCLDGNGHKISNVKIHVEDSDYVPRIKVRDSTYYETTERYIPSFIVAAEEIKDLTICNAQIELDEISSIPKNNSWDVSILAGSCTWITDCSIEGKVSITSAGTEYRTWASGFCNSGARMKNCKLKADVTFSGIQIFVGIASASKQFINCGIEGNIVGSAETGIAGIAWTGNSYSGNDDAKIEGCYTAEGITIHNTYGEKYDTGRGLAVGISNGVGIDYAVRNCTNNADICSDWGIAIGICYNGAGKKPMENCVNNGSISGGCYASGICRSFNGNNYSSYSMKNCVNNGSITQDAAKCGFGGAAGIVIDSSYCELEGCTNNGMVSGRTVAGIINKASYSATITECANYGGLKIQKPTSYSSVLASAGIIAMSLPSSGYEVKIMDCYNAGDIICQEQNSTVGGILGKDFDSSKRTTDNSKLTIETCYNVGKITLKQSGATSGSIVGEITGNTANTTIKGCHYLSGTASGAVGKGNNSAYKATKNSDAEMKKAATFSGWDFDSVWMMGTGNYKYPVFARGNLKQYTITLDANGGTVNGQASIEVETNTLGILRSAPRPVNGDARFMGWYTEATSGTRVTKDYTFIEDATIYAHWGEYDPTKRVEIENRLPRYADTNVVFRDETNWTYLEISFTTPVPVTGFDLSMGTLRLVEYDTRDTVYEVTSAGVLTKQRKGKGSKITLKLRTIDMDYGKWYTILVDDGFLVFEDPDNYAFVKDPDEWQFKTIIKPEKEKYITIRNETQGIEEDAELNYVFKYDDSLFYGPATTYDHTRTIWAFGLAMAGFESYNGGSRGGYKDGAKNARKMLKQFGFTCGPYDYFSDVDYSSNADYKKKPGRNTFGVYTAHKKITDDSDHEYTLIAVATRGAGYEAEWYSNALVGQGEHHSGFESASTKILDQLEDYIRRFKITGDVKIVMTGYSRAAASTNLAAARIDDGELTDALSDLDISIAKKDVYAYCFEPPANTKSVTGLESGYENITNILNPADPVPFVPLSNDGWYYKRYGRDLYMPNDALNSDNYASQKEKFLNWCRVLGVPYDDAEFKYDTNVLDKISLSPSLIYTIGGKEKFKTPMPIYSFNIKLCEELQRSVPTSGQYAKYLQRTISNVLEAAFCGGDVAGAAKLILEQCDFVIDDAGNVIDSDVDQCLWSAYVNKNTYKNGLLFQQHEPLVNFAWLISLNGEYEYRTIQTEDILCRMIFLNCPVDASVYNSSGELVAQIIDDIPQTIEGSYVCSYIDENDQKVFLLPNDDDFSIKINGTDDGTMDYSVAEYSLSQGKITKKQNYYSIPVTDEAEFEALIPEEGAWILSTDLQGALDADLSCTDDIPEYMASAEILGDGSVIGDGLSMVGDHVKLTAVPDPGAQFVGWFETEGAENPVSTDDEYRFRVTDDATVYAKFSEVGDEVFAVAIPDQTYTGSAIKPRVMIYDNKTKLKAGKDYTVSYKNNKNAYTYGEGDAAFRAKKAPQAVVKMKGSYSGKKTIYFKILPLNLSSNSFSASDLTVQYNGKKQTPAPTLTYKGKKLKLNTDYEVTEYRAAKNDKSAFKGSSGEDTGYVLTLTGKKNYTGTKKISLTILGKTTEGEEGEVTQVMMNSVKVPSIPAQSYRADEDGATAITAGDLLDKKGKPLSFTVTYKKSKKETIPLTEGTDYRISYRNNRKVGTASIILTGLGNKESESGISLVGTKTVNFKINGKNIKKAKVTGLASSYVYTGEEVIPTGYTVTLGGKELEYGDEYRVSFSKNIKTGTAAMTVTGTGPYTGSVKKTFKITKFALGTGGRKAESITVNDGAPVTAVFKKGGAKPEILLQWTRDGEEPVTLISGTDYKLKYKNNTGLTALSPASKKPTVTVTGKGNFSGSFSVDIDITAAELASLQDNAYAADKEYSSRKGAYRSAMTITDVDGKALKNGTDYTVTEYALIAAPDPDTGIVEDLAEPEVLDGNSIPKAGSVIRVTATAGTCYTSEDPAKNSLSTTYAILSGGKDISKAKITLKPSRPFNGKEVKLTAADFKSVKVGGKDLVFGEDYEVIETSYRKNTAKGTASVTLVGKGSYGGRKNITFKIGTRAYKGTIWQRILSALS